MGGNTEGAYIEEGKSFARNVNTKVEETLHLRPCGDNKHSSRNLTKYLFKPKVKETCNITSHQSLKLG